MSSPYSNTCTVAPAPSAKIIPGLVAWDGMIAHTDWRVLAYVFSDQTSIWCWVCIEDTWNSRTQQYDIDIVYRIRGKDRVQNHIALSGVIIWMFISRLIGCSPITESISINSSISSVANILGETPSARTSVLTVFCTGGVQSYYFGL